MLTKIDNEWRIYDEDDDRSALNLLIRSGSGLLARQNPVDYDHNSTNFCSVGNTIEQAIQNYIDKYILKSSRVRDFYYDVVNSDELWYDLVVWVG